MENHRGQQRHDIDQQVVRFGGRDYWVTNLLGALACFVIAGLGFWFLHDDPVMLAAPVAAAGLGVFLIFQQRHD